MRDTLTDIWIAVFAANYVREHGLTPRASAQLADQAVRDYGNLPPGLQTPYDRLMSQPVPEVLADTSALDARLKAYGDDYVRDRLAQGWRHRCESCGCSWSSGPAKCPVMGCRGVVRLEPPVGWVEVKQGAVPR